MNSEPNMLRSPEEWNSQWEKWFNRYSQGNPRLGKWLASKYNISKATILEIGAGSGRESRFLSQRAKSVTCADFAPLAVRLLADSNLPPNMNAVEADAYNLPFSDKLFDLTFHKGFWILFDNNEKVEHLLREQLRVTRNVVSAIVQNSLNLKQVSKANAMAQNDSLFCFRFFRPNELEQLAWKVVSECGINAKIRILKYGSPSLSRALIPFGALGDSLASKFYTYLPWSLIECAALEIIRD
jgi:SAM-dependent methyltransferase